MLLQTIQQIKKEIWFVVTDVRNKSVDYKNDFKLLLDCMQALYCMYSERWKKKLFDSVKSLQAAY